MNRALLLSAVSDRARPTRLAEMPAIGQRVTLFHAEWLEDLTVEISHSAPQVCPRECVRPELADQLCAGLPASYDVFEVQVVEGQDTGWTKFVLVETKVEGAGETSFLAYLSDPDFDLLGRNLHFCQNRESLIQTWDRKDLEHVRAIFRTCARDVPAIRHVVVLRQQLEQEKGWEPALLRKRMSWIRSTEGLCFRGGCERHSGWIGGGNWFHNGQLGDPLPEKQIHDCTCSLTSSQIVGATIVWERAERVLFITPQATLEHVDDALQFINSMRD